MLKKIEFKVSLETAKKRKKVRSFSPSKRICRDDYDHFKPLKEFLLSSLLAAEVENFETFKIV